MAINHQKIIEQLADNRAVFKSLLFNMSEEEVKWKPGERKWSILEIVNHLYDEEREDFRFRLQSLLEDPAKPWPAISPAEWVIERQYSQRNFDESLANFLNEREKSLTWLARLSNPDWKQSYHHPQIGKISGEQMLANWLAHDYLHIRQIVRMKYDYLATIAAPLSLAYAGNW